MAAGIERMTDDELSEAIREACNTKPDWYDYTGDIQAEYLEFLLTEQERRRRGMIEGCVDRRRANVAEVTLIDDQAQEYFAVIASPLEQRLDELWVALVRADNLVSKATPTQHLRRADYRDGMLAAYCIVSGYFAETVIERLRKESA